MLGRRRWPRSRPRPRARRCAMPFFTQLLLGHELGIAAQQNVGAAAGHVGGDGDHAQASGLGDDLGFPLVELGVQHDVPDALPLQDLGEALRLFDRGGAHQHRLLLLVQLLNLVGDGEVFFFLGAVDDVGILDAQHRLVGGDDDDFELVDLVELGASVSAVPVMPASFLYMRK